MVPQWIIEKKRDGHALAEGELRDLIAGYARGDIPDYQMAAWAMAVFFRGLDLDETVVLTDAMMRSGALVDTSGLPCPTADKHSTGGVGDKVSLILAPLAACCGVAVPMMSGRGLGITGGTLDKLEAIPGYRTALDVPQFLRILEQCGCSIIGQTEDLVPADRKLYALRDVTGTVPSIPLITASILSKKFAEGAGALVLDVKWGRGAFMRTEADARALAEMMRAVGNRMERRTTALLTDMNEPLGHAAGNAVEVAETIACLRGEGPADLLVVTLELGACMLTMTGRAQTHDAALDALRKQLDTGAALERFREMVRLHGGDPDVVDHPERLPAAHLTEAVTADRTGYVTQADAGALGRACVLLGAGRTRTEDTVDPAVGLTRLAKTGQAVERGDVLAVLHANDAAMLAAAREPARDAFTVGDAPPPARRLVAHFGEDAA
jgi:pyrimidine-nucleoside phosphorylase